MEEIPSLPKIVLKDFDILTSSDKSSSRTSSLPKLYTVAHSLNNAYIYKNLKPDLGSLNQFIDGELNFKQEMKKKKHEKPQEPQQKRIKTFMLLRKKCPQEVLKNKQSTPIQRKVAAKMLLDGIFAKQFGEEPEQFFQNNYKQRNQGEAFKNIDKILDKTTGITPTLQQILNDFDHNKKTQENLKVNCYEDIRKSAQSGNKQFEQRKFKRRIIYNQQKLRLEFNKSKLKYKTLSKLKMPDAKHLNEIQESLNSLKTKYQNLVEFDEANKYKSQCRKARSICLPTSIEDKPSFIISDSHFVLRKVSITLEEFYWLMARNISYQNIRVIYLQEIVVAEEMLCLFFEMLGRYALYIEQLTLINVTPVNSPKIIPVLKNLVGNLFSLRIFCINQCKIDTKTFCYLCLGIGQSTSLQYVEANKNQIDSRVIKSLQIMIRYIGQLLFVDLSGNKLQLTGKQMKAIKGFLDNYKNKSVFLN